MRDFEEKNDGKLEGREIKFGSPERVERPHGKLYRWFDNFWYHHKWKTIAALFAVIVLTVCIAQMCSRESAGDVSVVMAGPYGFTDGTNNYNDIVACLSTYLAADYDENGEKRTQINSFTVYSADQIKALAEQDVLINTSSNGQTYQSFYQSLSVGEAAVLFLDPWLFEEMCEKNGYLVDIKGELGFVPEGGIVKTAEGGEGIFGVRLGDTALYRENSVMRTLPEDTVICLLAPLFMGKNSDPAEYAKSVEYFNALVDKPE